MTVYEQLIFVLATDNHPPSHTLTHLPSIGETSLVHFLMIRKDFRFTFFHDYPFYYDEPHPDIFLIFHWSD